MSDTNLEMGKKRSRQQQSSNVAIAAIDSSESGDCRTEKTSPIKQVCSHVAKSIDGNQLKKCITLYVNGTKPCAHCKEGNEKDNKSLEGNGDFWICLRCGATTCSTKHSSFHYDVPRSDSHALTLNIPAFSVWCHACKADIPTGYSKKLKTCISSIEQLYNKHINLQTFSQQEVKNSSENNVERVGVKESKSLNDPLPLSSPKKKSGQIANTAPAVRGLTNLGNTCFFNSVLQCLAQTPGLVEAIREMKTPDQEVNIVLKSGASLNGKLGQWDTLSECLADTLVKLKSGGPVVSPDRLLSLLTKKQTQFQGYRQHDAHELFTYLIDSVRMTDHKRYRKLILSEFGLYGKQEHQGVPEEVTKKLKALDHEVAEIITFAPEKVFKGRLVNSIQCQECRSVKTFEESFLDLSLPIVPDKPQPPCMRRKGGHQQVNQNQAHFETVQEANKTAAANSTTGQTMSKSNMKERRLQRKKNRKNGKNSNVTEAKQDETDSPPALIEDVQGHMQQQESDVEGDVEDNSEETNCGGKDFPIVSESSAGIVAIDVSCGNQEVGVDTNRSLILDLSEKEKSVKHLHSTSPLCQEEEGESHLIADLLGVEKSDTPRAEDGLNINQPGLTEQIPSHSDSFYLQSTNVEGKSSECSGEKSSCEAQVSAWLNTSDLKDPDEADTNMSPLLCHDSNSGVNDEVIPNRLPAQTQTSISSNHQNFQLSLDDTTRSSYLTGTQETQESGYCSEKVGCPESPQRDGSPCSLDGLSPAWSGVEGGFSSRSDVSVEEVFNHNTAAVGKEDESEEVANTSLNELQPVNRTTKMVNLQERGSLMRSCHPPAHVRRRAKSPPHSQNAQLEGPKRGSSLDSAIMCSKWLEESSTVPTLEVKTGVTDDIPFEKLPPTGGNTLGDIPEEEGDVMYGPLNKGQMMNGYNEESDTNSNDLSSTTQGFIARPGSPCEEDNDAKDLEINAFNEEESLPTNKTNNLVNGTEFNSVSDKTSEGVLNGRIAGGSKDADSSCGCQRLQRQDSVDNCCLHTSLAQSTQVELMTGCNKIVCDTCTGNGDGKSVYTNSTKQTLISQAPPALVIHLKRFQVQMMNCRKLCKHVSFPLQLDLTPYSIPSVQRAHKQTNDIKSDLLYNLYGVVEHSGTLNGGHYVSYVKISQDNSSWWYCISDSHVSQVSETRVLSAQAYLLFYKKMTTT